jgi:hypothetical protein
LCCFSQSYLRIVALAVARLGAAIRTTNNTGSYTTLVESSAFVFPNRWTHTCINFVYNNGRPVFELFQDTQVVGSYTTMSTLLYREDIDRLEGFVVGDHGIDVDDVALASDDLSSSRNEHSYRGMLFYNSPQRSGVDVQYAVCWSWGALVCRREIA